MSRYLGSRRALLSGNSGVVSIVATDHKVDATDLQTYTFSACAFGAEGAGRRIIVGIGARKGTATLSITSVTIGGVPAREVVTSIDSVADNIAALYIADVPSGTAGNVVVTLNEAGIQRCGIGVWAMTGAASGIASDTDSNTGTSSTSATLSRTLTIPPNGAAVAYDFTTGTALTATWTNLTEAFDETVESGVFQTGANADFGAGGDTALQVVWSATTSTPQVGVFAAWAP